MQLRMTEKGKHALATDGTDMSSMEVRTLVMVVRGPKNALELLTAVRKSDPEYAFLDVKHVALAAGGLTDKGYAEWYDENPPEPEPDRRSKRSKRGRHH